MEDIPKYNLQLLLFSLHRTFGVEKISTVQPEEGVLYSESLSGKIFSGQIFALRGCYALRELPAMKYQHENVQEPQSTSFYGGAVPPSRAPDHLLE